MKLRSFQYRLVMRAIITNIHLKRWKIVNTENCGLCGKYPETYQHLMWDCEKVQTLWSNVKEICVHMGVVEEDDINLSYPNVILNSVTPDPRNVCNLIVLCAKQYIYSRKCLKEPINVFEFKKTVVNIKCSEKYYAIRDNKMYQYLKKWEPRYEMPSDLREQIEQYIEQEEDESSPYI